MTLLTHYITASMVATSLFLSGCTSTSVSSDRPDGHHVHHEPVTEMLMSPSAFQPANERMMMDMHSIELTGDVDYDFVVGMIPHHQGAIDMATILLDSGEIDESLRPLAQAIVAAQSSEIDFMQTWLERHGAPQPHAASQQIITAYAQINAKMMMAMHQPHSRGDINRDFVDGMIPHHQAAVAMAEVVLEFSVDPELRQMAQAVIREQNREIMLMQAY